MNKNNKIWTEVFEKGYNNYSPETPIINGTGELSAQQNEGEASGFASISLNNGEGIIDKFVENGGIYSSIPFKQMPPEALVELGLSSEEIELVKDSTYVMILGNIATKEMEKNGLKPQTKLIVTILDSSEKYEFTIEKDFVVMFNNSEIPVPIPYHLIKTIEPEDPQFIEEPLDTFPDISALCSYTVEERLSSKNISSGNFSHAEGDNTTASGNFSHAEGQETNSNGKNSHAEGYRTKAWGEGSHAEGLATKPNGIISSQEINIIQAQHFSYDEYVSFSISEESQIEIHEGKIYLIGNHFYRPFKIERDRPHIIKVYADIQKSTPEPPLGIQIMHQVIGATCRASHTEGEHTAAFGVSSHAEGLGTIASGQEASHAEGRFTTASGKASHAEGYSTTASGEASHAEGYYNVDVPNAIHMVGVGNYYAYKNAHTITTDGKHYILGLGTYQGTEDGSVENPLPEGQDLATIINGKLTTKNVTVTGTGNVISNVTIGNDSVTFSKDKTIYESNLKQSHEPTETTAEITPNILHVWGVVAELNITFKVPTDTTIVNEYMFQFSTGQTPATLTLPSTIKWLNGEAPIIGANRTYQISVVDNLAVFGGF